MASRTIVDDTALQLYKLQLCKDCRSAQLERDRHRDGMCVHVTLSAGALYQPV